MADVAAAARVAAKRRASAVATMNVNDSESATSDDDDGDPGTSSDDDRNDQTLGDESLATLRTSNPGAGPLGEAMLPFESGSGWWGFDERPLEPLLDRPLALTDDAPAHSADERRAAAKEALETMLAGPGTVSARLVRWMNDEGVADVAGVAAAVSQMHAVTAAARHRSAAATPRAPRGSAGSRRRRGCRADRPWTGRSCGRYVDRPWTGRRDAAKIIEDGLRRARSRPQVQLSPPGPPPGGRRVAQRRLGAAAAPEALDDGDAPHFGPPLARLLHARAEAPLPGVLGRLRLQSDPAHPTRTPRVVLLGDSAEDDAGAVDAALVELARARCAAVTAALDAAVGKLALAFACQGNWIMRRQVYALARDGASALDLPALAVAADDLATAEAAAERARRLGEVGSRARDEAPVPDAPSRRRRLLFAALCVLLQEGLSDSSADVFAAATRLLVDVFRGRKKRRRSVRAPRDSRTNEPGHEISFVDATSPVDAKRPQEGVLEPAEVLRGGVRSSGVPLREAVVALRRLLPLVAQRASRPRRDPAAAGLRHAAARRAAKRATQCLARLARMPWLGPPLVAAAVLPPASPRAAKRRVDPDPRTSPKFRRGVREHARSTLHCVSRRQHETLRAASLDGNTKRCALHCISRRQHETLAYRAGAAGRGRVRRERAAFRGRSREAVGAAEARGGAPARASPASEVSLSRRDEARLG